MGFGHAGQGQRQLVGFSKWVGIGGEHGKVSEAKGWSVTRQAVWAVYARIGVGLGFLAGLVCRLVRRVS